MVILNFFANDTEALMLDCGGEKQVVVATVFYLKFFSDLLDGLWKISGGDVCFLMGKQSFDLFFVVIEKVGDLKASTWKIEQLVGGVEVRLWMEFIHS